MASLTLFMKYLNKIPFLLVFVFFFSITLIVLGLVQAISGTLRLFNPSEEKYEQLQQYQIYNSNELTNNSIHVTIGEKPSQTRTDVFAYIEKTQQDRDAALLTLPTEKAERIEQKVQDIISSAKVSIPNEEKQVQEVPFASPVEVQVKPKTSPMPTGYNSAMYSILEGVFFKEVLWKFPLIVDINRTSPRGQMANKSITLSGKIRSFNEVAKVLVHELGHMVDIYFLHSS